MEYISAEEFLKQTEEIQKVFLDWWKENVKQYDLFYRNFKGERQKYIVVKSEGYELETLTLRNKKISGGRDSWTEGWNIKCIWDIVPLLTEGQLRKFIEDKTGCENVEITSDIECEEYRAWLFKNTHSASMEKRYENLGADKFKSYWRLALEIAKEKVKED